MTYYGSSELAASFRGVRQHTIQIAEDVPEDKYDFSATPDTRSIGKTLVHVAVSPGFQLHLHQNRIDDLKKVDFAALMQRLHAAEAAPRTKVEVVELLKREGDMFTAFLESLPEDVLAERVSMPPGAQPTTKSRFEMLLSPKEHGQLMLLQRMIGLKPHLTRQMEERLAERARQAQLAGR